MAKTPKTQIFDQTSSVFVSGIEGRVTEEILWELFLQVNMLNVVIYVALRLSLRPRRSRPYGLETSTVF